MFSELDLILHAIALPFDGDGFGMMKETIEDGGSEGAVVVEDLRPFLERLVGGEDDGAVLVALGDDLKEQVSAFAVDGQIAELVQDKN